MSTTVLLEATMLICFGAAWPLANLRMLRSRRAEGRGLLPTSLILCGYCAGMAAKVLCACAGGGLAPIFWLYFLNAVSVGLNLWLQIHFGSATPGRPLADRARTTLERIRGLPRAPGAPVLR